MNAKLLYSSLFVITVILFSCKDEERSKGCTDILASNYNPNAKVNDGSCVYNSNGGFPVTGHGHHNIIGGGGSGTSTGTLTVPKKNMGLIALKTALWCGPCGSQGNPTFIQAYTENEGKAVALKVHSSDAFSVSYLDNDFSSNFNITGIPRFVACTNNSAWPLSTINNEVTQHISNEMVFVNGAARGTLKGDKLEIEARARFFEEMSGEYYMAVYVLEDGLKAEQTGYQGIDAPIATHNNVVRAVASLSAFGEKISEEAGITPQGKVVNLSYTLDFNPSWKKEKLKLAVIIWKKDEATGNFSFVNANQ